LLAKHVEAQVAPDGSAQIDWKVDVSGSSASSWRQRYHAKATQKQRVQEDLSSEMPATEIASVSANDLEDVEQKVQLRAKGKAPAFARNDAGTWTVPLGAKEHMVRSWAPLSSRREPMRIFALSTTENETVVKLPQGAKIVTPPRSAEGKTAFGTYKIDAEVKDNVVRVKTTVAMTRSRILASEYAGFRQFCEQADRDLGQTVTYTLGK
jgi:hypothetical protein